MFVERINQMRRRRRRVVFDWICNALSWDMSINMVSTHTHPVSVVTRVDANYFMFAIVNLKLHAHYSHSIIALTDVVLVYVHVVYIVWQSV